MLGGNQLQNDAFKTAAGSKRAASLAQRSLAGISGSMAAARHRRCGPETNFAFDPVPAVWLNCKNFDQAPSKYATHFFGCQLSCKRHLSGLTVRAAPRPASAV